MEEKTDETSIYDSIKAEVSSLDGEETLKDDEEKKTRSLEKEKDFEEQNSGHKDSQDNRFNSEAREGDDEIGDSSGSQSPQVGSPEEATPLDFYGPVEIPSIMFICVTMMLFYEEGKQLRDEWNIRAEAMYSVITVRFMLLVYGIWICGFVLLSIQFVKYLAMLLNKHFFKFLHRTPISVRLKVIFAMVATKVGTAFWKDKWVRFVCDGNNVDYPACEDGTLFTMSSYLATGFGCQYNPDLVLCKELLLQGPMIFMAISAFLLGKYIIPAGMNRFRRTEEAEREANSNSSAPSKH